MDSSKGATKMVIDLSDNNLIKFRNVQKKKGEMVATFKMKGIKGGTEFSASISVSIDAANVDPADPLEKIVEECARVGVRDFKNSEFTFEGVEML